MVALDICEASDDLERPGALQLEREREPCSGVRLGKGGSIAVHFKPHEIKPWPAIGQPVLRSSVGMPSYSGTVSLYYNHLWHPDGLAGMYQCTRTLAAERQQVKCTLGGQVEIGAWVQFLAPHPLAALSPELAVRAAQALLRDARGAAKRFDQTASGSAKLPVESTHWVGANSQRLPKVISITYSNEWVPLARFETPRSTLVRSGFKWLHAVVTSTGDTVTRIPKRGDLPCSRHIGMGSVGTHICCSQRGSQSENHGVTHRRVSLSIIHTESALEDGRFVRRSY